MTQKLFFVKFVPIPQPTPLNLGCGVTAYSVEDALSLIRDQVFPRSQMPEVVSIREIREVSELDQNHVVPNMGNTLARGVWFPLQNRSS